jgi:hypothetical protein
MYGYYSPKGLNQPKTRVSCSPRIDLIDLHSLSFYFKYLTTDR